MLPSPRTRITTNKSDGTSCTATCERYCISGNPKYYSRSKIWTIQSEIWVQQGDPLGILHFALAIHPLLLDIGARHPEVFISAYADNCIITGPLSKVQAAVHDYDTTLRRAGLSLNPPDSAVYIPAWQSLTTKILAQLSVTQDPEGHLRIFPA